MVTDSYSSVAYLLNHTFSKMLLTNFSLRPVVGSFNALYRNSGCFVLHLKNGHAHSYWKWSTKKDAKIVQVEVQ